MAAYNYLNQSIQATCLIEPKDIDSFYNPITLGHTGFAWDGTLYSSGVQVQVSDSPVYASWYTEGQNLYRGLEQSFPQAGLVLLSQVALTIFDTSNDNLALWMQFLIQDQYALADNWNYALNGWLPSGVLYTDGVVSVTYIPDPGSETGISSTSGAYNVNSNMVVHIDFTQDKVYVDVAVQPV